MRHTFDLSSLPWKLSGYHPHFWRGKVSMETGMVFEPEVSAPAVVPGSVQKALRDAGILPDWNVQLNSRECEWVENRHWVFQATLPQDSTSRPGRQRLHCQGLDYQGVVLINHTVVGEFCGSMTPHTFDLTSALVPGDNLLSIVFTGVPDALGQLHFTSRIHQWKPRFNYIWDWVPRIVQIGILDEIHLSVDEGDAIENFRAFTRFDHAAGVGTIELAADLAGARARRIQVIVQDAGQVIHQQEVPFTADFRLAIGGLPVKAWNPNGSSQQPLYALHLMLLDDAGAVLDRQCRSIGFRQIQWMPCAGAPADAQPWVCRINGKDTFLQGFNWVPIRPNFADVTEADYRKRLELYRDLGTNILRVWGGAVLERECFYRLCDELGILVWQEFPLSSSGIDNWPPEQPQVIAEMEQIVRSYIQRRQHHASLLMWCGGNELQGALDGGKVGTGKPVDCSHPMMAAMQRMVAAMDPTRRFIPTSASGPRFMASADDFGKGLHHDVHGPWGHAGPVEKSHAYWDRDDALFRSEVGMPGASPAAMVRQYGKEMAMPATRQNPYWMHCASWWIQWDDYLAEKGDPGDLEAFVRWSQQRQAVILQYAAKACKSRFPACGGLIVWMGHDCFPCPGNTSVIDYDGNPKPAALALAKVFREIPGP